MLPSSITKAKDVCDPVCSSLRHEATRLIITDATYYTGVNSSTRKYPKESRSERLHGQYAFIKLTKHSSMKKYISTARSHLA